MTQASPAGPDPSPPPPRSPRSARARDVIVAARCVLEAEGPEALTMRRLGHELGIQAPSIYKHFPDKAAVESALIEDALVEIGEALHRAVARPGRRGTDRAGRRRVDAPVARSGRSVMQLLDTYRLYSVGHPNLYRLATAGCLNRAGLPAGLEDWAGEPFLLATADPYRAQALWSFAHGMVILEIDGRFPEDSDLDRTWRAGAVAFTSG